MRHHHVIENSLGTALLLSIALLPWLAKGEAWRYSYGYTSNTFYGIAQSTDALGYRAISLSSASNLLSAVWLRDYQACSAVSLFIRHDKLQENVQTMWAKGYRPVSLAVCGQIPNETYVVSYFQDRKEAVLFSRLTESELLAQPTAIPGGRVIWIAATGAGDAARFSGMVLKDGASGKLESGLDKAAMEAKIALLAKDGYRPVSITAFPGALSGLTYAASWVQESKSSRWTNVLAVPLSDVGAVINSLQSESFRPEVYCLHSSEIPGKIEVSLVAVEDLPTVWSITGKPTPDFDGLDQAMTNAMLKGNCTRAALAVSKDGRLVLSRGYTHHPLNIYPTQPTNLFRLASISKTITAVTVMGLAEAGRLGLDDKIGNYIDLRYAADKRWTNITVKHLLQHRGGWNRDDTFDPLFIDDTVSSTLKVPLPVTQDHIIKYMQRFGALQADPGKTFSYSNFGYLLLVKIIEAVTGQSYENFVRENVLRPLGVNSAHLSRSLRDQAWPGEVEYEEGDSIGPSVVSQDRCPTAMCYGGFNLENASGVGAWAMSAADLVRLCSSFFDRTNSPLLGPDVAGLMWAFPGDFMQITPKYKDFYACGWMVRGADQNSPEFFYHNGNTYGTRTIMVLQADGYAWAALFNTWNYANGSPWDLVTLFTKSTFRVQDIAPLPEWPTNDLFDVDIDGLPDSFERAHFSSLEASNGSGDADSDGVSDSEEWLALSNPNDPTDWPRVTFGRAEDGSPTLQFSTHNGRRYVIQTASGLNQDWHTAQSLTGFNGDGFEHSLPIITTEPTTFFRLRIEPRVHTPAPGQ